MRAVRRPNYYGIERALDHGADIDGRDETNLTVLDNAVESGRTDIVELLVLRGANVNARGGTTGFTSLMRAAQDDRADIVDLLLQYGANPNAINEKGNTALDIAVKNNSTAAIDRLHKATHQ